MKQILVYIIVISLFCSLVVGCSSVKVTRTDADQPTDLSGKWNETDSSLVSQYMVEKLLQDSWYRVFRSIHDRKPVVKVNHIKNKTTEHIPTKTFINDIELALLKSNQVDLVASNTAEKEVQKEREDNYQQNINPAGIRIYTEREVDFILLGTIYSIEDELADIRTVYYQVDLELISIATNEKVWTGQKRIKKIVEKPLVTW